MNIPVEFVNRVFKTKLSGLSSSARSINQIREIAPDSEIDVIYESGRAVVVIVFETQEDCLAFTLKYGKNYV
jgi:hypothetical protein